MISQRAALIASLDANVRDAARSHLETIHEVQDDGGQFP